MAMYGNEYQNTPPVKEGEEIDVTIEAVGEKGDGIAKKDGFVIFVPGTKGGDEVRIKVTRVLSKVGFGEKIGDAEKKASAKPEKPAEPEFDPQPELDSEDFGDDSEDEEAAKE
jgi:predicted RNA-binding protein with TRAM domain